MKNKTKICCLDVDKSIIDLLSKDFDVYDGSLGKKVKVDNVINTTTHLLPNCDFPENLHEYDILIDDMYKIQTIEYNAEEHKRKNVIGESAFYFISRFPESLFNPIPYACKILSQKLKYKKDKLIIKILFHCSKYNSEYRIGNITEYETKSCTYSNYEYLNNFTENQLNGSKVNLYENKLSSLLFEPFLSKISYTQTFRVPTIWNDEQANYIDDNRFLPLLKNQNGDVVSYVWKSDNDITFLFPQMDNETKVSFLSLFFNEILYKYFSEYFPAIKANAWTNNEVYYLPNQKSLLQKKEDNKQQFEIVEKKIEEELLNNQQKYEFLHKILVETDTELVNALIVFLKWLGINNPIAKDETNESGILEEDIQIDLGEKGLLIVEAKGIGGTSKDSECSQINKIKLRRCEERGLFDVHALYVVNNERHIEPLKRTIPPFNPTQIKDAQNEKRGMIYTYQLFNLFFNIENGFITKGEAISKLFQFGLVDFTPNLKILGTPYHYYKDNKVICIDLQCECVKIGDYLAFEINGRYYKRKIISIQQEKQSVNEVEKGKVGIELESPIPNIKNAYLMSHE